LNPATATGSGAVQIRYRSEREICATWGAVVIRICDGSRTEIADLERVEALFDELLAHKPAVGMLLVFTHDTPLPSLATQRHAADGLRRLRGRLVLATATVGLGFWATTFRAGLDALFGALGGGVVVEGRVEAAAERLAGELIGIDPAGLVAVYGQLWAELTK
jgi:hypothetical protein